MKDVMEWFRTLWPVIALIVALGLAGMQRFHALETRIALCENNVSHVHEKLDTISADVKEMKQYLMNPVR